MNNNENPALLTRILDAIRKSCKLTIVRMVPHVIVFISQSGFCLYPQTKNPNTGKRILAAGTALTLKIPGSVINKKKHEDRQKTGCQRIIQIRRGPAVYKHGKINADKHGIKKYRAAVAVNR